ncbi:SGNH/GDSL hydrolase family protein [Zobellia uliginosa]|uniref:SGNH/GDSL hydrolase family protein n=1 Tax=Zobellia uliginosa TaxID=143224 RepID=UPI001C0724FD|nr:SGNH/GDSL hydrolase family protein [Zobellia uliginosa]MBU2946224.1 SGNH/GDSL hydrolase family protein [Zobellia uliginosa]
MKLKPTLLAVLMGLGIINGIKGQDWPNLNQFQAENDRLAKPAPDENRVVFMGNSITIGWINSRPEFFANKSYVNRGISGQTTPQMLVRFRQDVVNLEPKVMILLAGTNDIAGNTGPSTLEMIMANIKSMADIAAANDIKVILSSTLPAFAYPWKPGVEPAQKIVNLNKMIKAYAEEKGHIYLDYFSAMADERNGLPKKFAKDGVHPTVEGYKIMEPLVEKAITEALKK